MTKLLPLFSVFALLATTAHAHVWQVGPTRMYTLPSQVAALVSSGDTVEIDAAAYDDCCTWSADNLLLRGVGGRPHLKNKTCSNKGIWILFGNNTTIENIEFSGAVSSDWNGAGVRAQGGSFTIRGCYIHHNQMGVLASMTDSANVLIEHSVFDANVSPNESLFAHNIYINTCDTFTLQYCYVHGAQVGHEVKSRAYVNFVLYNRITNEDDSASRDIDLPNGGQAYVIGNMIEKGPNADNTNTLGFGLEGMKNPGPQNLYVVNNTFVNDLPAKGIYFILPSSGFDTLLVKNNIFAGTGVLLNGSPSYIDSTTNLFTSDIPSVGFVDHGHFNYHLTVGSPAIGAGSPAGFARGFSLTPEFEYADTANAVARVHLKSQPIAQGAYEYNGSEAVRSPSRPDAQLHAVYDRERSLIMIDLPPEAGLGSTVTVYDMLGHALAAIAADGRTNITIPVANIPSGLYFIRLVSPTSVLTTSLAVTR
ncbi:MAG: right-handed parallel beta-helix repeat-containing protein [Bacteroidetes bacterium]|nr:right-handed parallel beta-helix repeat-containing protein [Bacteroidota bacterium]